MVVVHPVENLYPGCYVVAAQSPPFAGLAVYSPHAEFAVVLARKLVVCRKSHYDARVLAPAIGWGHARWRCFSLGAATDNLSGAPAPCRACGGVLTCGEHHDFGFLVKGRSAA